MIVAEEKRFETKVKKFLASEGCWFVKFFANAFTKSGVPDLLVCCNGRFLGVELKASNGRPSELQKYNIRRIEEAGGIGLILYPKDFEDFKELIRAIKRGDAPTCDVIENDI